MGRWMVAGVLLMTQGYAVGVACAQDAQVEGAATRERAREPEVTREQEASRQRDAEARLLFRAGRSAFEDERYTEALEHFRGAYRLSGRAELLYNVGESADRAGLIDDAVTAFEAFLAADPEATRRREVEARLRNLRRLQSQAPPPDMDAFEDALAEENAARDEPIVVVAPPVVEDPEVDDSRRRPWWVVGVAGAVVAAVAVGLAIGLSGRETFGSGAEGDAVLHALEMAR